MIMKTIIIMIIITYLSIYTRECYPLIKWVNQYKTYIYTHTYTHTTQPNLILLNSPHLHYNSTLLPCYCNTPCFSYSFVYIVLTFIPITLRQN